MNRAKKKLLVIGMYGAGSAGDDAMLQSIVEAFPEYAISVPSGDSFPVGSFFGVSSIRCRMYEGMSLPILLSVLWSSCRLFARLLRSDALLFGGGSLIHDLTGYNLPFFFFWHAVARLLKKPVVYFGIGIGPVETKTGQRLCRYYLSRATLLLVRDRRGKEICDRLGVSNAVLSHDIVFLRAGKAAPEDALLSSLRLQARQYVVVSGCSWFQTSNFWAGKTSFAEEIENYAACLQIVRSVSNLPLVYAATNRHDVALGERLKAYFPEGAFITLPDSLNCVQLQAVFAGCGFVFSVRMHSAIFAANASRPFFCAVYDEKVASLLEQTGTGEYSMPIEQMTPERLKPLFNRFYQHRADIEAHLERTVAAFSAELEGRVAEIKMCIDQNHARGSR